MAIKASPCFEIVDSLDLLPRLHEGAGLGCRKALSGTKINLLAASGRRVDYEPLGIRQTRLCTGIRRITLDRTRQKFEHSLYYVKHRSPGLDEIFVSETTKTIMLRRRAQ
jgi:hypothetical protein